MAKSRGFAILPSSFRFAVGVSLLPKVLHSGVLVYMYWVLGNTIYTMYWVDRKVPAVFSNDYFNQRKQTPCADIYVYELFGAYRYMYVNRHMYKSMVICTHTCTAHMYM